METTGESEKYMTVSDLMSKVLEELKKAGFETELEFGSAGNAHKSEMFRYESDDGSRPRPCGWRVRFEVVHRHNGEKENKSVDLKIYKWEKYYGYEFAKERLNVNHSEKQIQNRIKRIIDTYSTLK